MFFAHTCLCSRVSCSALKLTSVINECNMLRTLHSTFCMELLIAETCSGHFLLLTVTCTIVTLLTLVFMGLWDYTVVSDKDNREADFLHQSGNSDEWWHGLSRKTEPGKHRCFKSKLHSGLVLSSYKVISFESNSGSWQCCCIKSLRHY